MKNVILEKIPSKFFRDNPNLKYLVIQDAPKLNMSDLSLRLENLEQLRIIGTKYHNPIIPSNFLHNS